MNKAKGLWKSMTDDVKNNKFASVCVLIGGFCFGQKAIFAGALWTTMGICVRVHDWHMDRQIEVASIYSWRLIHRAMKGDKI